ncbi:hypothetical protein B0H10DRAFT_1954844 [Mycena sp. CBHHK59/15]|nr:hypothetical protein B0H10DRAFT_1954844 [Mycena sp. CBHHK59/15]
MSYKTNRLLDDLLLGLLAVTIAMVRQQPCHGCHARSISHFSQRPTERPWHGRNPVVTAFFGDQDRKIARRLERTPTKKRQPESRTLASPPTSSALSRVLPVGVPIDFWTPQFYNEKLDLHEKAIYVNTGVAFPLPQFCTTEHHKD